MSKGEIKYNLSNWIFCQTLWPRHSVHCVGGGVVGGGGCGGSCGGECGGSYGGGGDSVWHLQPIRGRVSLPWWHRRPTRGHVSLLRWHCSPMRTGQDTRHTSKKFQNIFPNVLSLKKQLISETKEKDYEYDWIVKKKMWTIFIISNIVISFVSATRGA